MHPQVVVFTDIDGTLVDTFTRQYGKSKELVRRLEEASVPVVLCSSKTRAEQDVIRNALGLESEPFIVENGGAIVIPRGYFDKNNYDVVVKEREVATGEGGIAGRTSSSHSIRSNSTIAECTRDNGKYITIELGRPSLEIKNALRDIRDRENITFKSVNDLTIEQLAKIVGMTLEEAANMSKREYGETVLEIDRAQEKRFEQILSQKGFKVIHGGRYFDVTAGNNKGKAVKILADLFRRKLGDETIFVGVGDSANDLSMLRSTNVAILVQNHNGTWVDTEDISDVTRVNGIGPAGWENAFAKIMEIKESGRAGYGGGGGGGRRSHGK